MIKNKVAESGIITLDLEKYYPQQDIVEFDLKPFLFMEMILKEKEYRDKMEDHNWSTYHQKTVAVFCSADAILPMWAYMLVASKLSDHSAGVYYGDKQTCFEYLFVQNLQKLDTAEFFEKRVVVKGCGDKPIPEAAYLEIASRLTPVVKTLMYGEPCSTVPVYKRKKPTE